MSVATTTAARSGAPASRSRSTSAASRRGSGPSGPVESTSPALARRFARRSGDEAVHHDVELRLLHVHVGDLDGDVRQPLGCRARDGQHGGLAVRVVGAVSTDHERRSHALTSNR